MPYHLELGSEGHSFHGKAIVVNSQTGEHKTKHPLPIDLAKAQMKALENREAPPAPKAKKETHEDYKGPRNKDGTPKKSTKAWGEYVRERDRPKPKMMKTKHEGMKEEIPEREGEGVKEVKAKKDMSKLKTLVKDALKADSSKVFKKDSGGEDSERSYSFVFDKPDGYSAKEVEEVMFELIPEHHEKLSEKEGQWEYEFMAETDDVNKYLREYINPAPKKEEPKKKDEAPEVDEKSTKEELKKAILSFLRKHGKTAKGLDARKKETLLKYYRMIREKYASK